jgi:DUF2934 family protein
MAAPIVDISTHGQSRQATASSGRSIGTATFKRSGAAPIFDPADTGLREEMIRQAAYFRSQHRGHFPGNELEDWLTAEREIDEMIARVRSHSGERWRTAYRSRVCGY